MRSSLNSISSCIIQEQMQVNEGIYQRLSLSRDIPILCIRKSSSHWSELPYMVLVRDQVSYVMCISTRAVAFRQQTLIVDEITNLWNTAIWSQILKLITAQKLLGQLPLRKNNNILWNNKPDMLLLAITGLILYYLIWYI